jgi:hypothetical protein
MHNYGRRSCFVTLLHCRATPPQGSDASTGVAPKGRNLRICPCNIFSQRTIDPWTVTLGMRGSVFTASEPANKKVWGNVQAGKGPGACSANSTLTSAEHEFLYAPPLFPVLRHQTISFLQYSNLQSPLPHEQAMSQYGGELAVLSKACSHCRKKKVKCTSFEKLHA